jgi:hypothetical protein
MCQQWFSVAGHFLEIFGFILVALELRKLFGPAPAGAHRCKYTIGAGLMVIGMLGQTAGGWVGRLPISWIASCY